MAGQPPQEPPWQPQGQDDGRQGWQAYSPPSAADSKETYAYPQSGAAPAPGYGQGYAQDRPVFTPTPQEPAAEQDQVYYGADPSYTVADPSYTVADPSYTVADPSYTVADQPYAGPPGAPGQDQGAPQWRGQAAPQWNAPRQGSAKTAGASKGFVSSLFDFSFTSFVTPKIIKALYVLVTIWTVIWALIFLRLGFKYGGAAGGIFTLIVVVPVFGLLTLGAFRMLLEFFMVAHRIHDELKAIRERGDNRL